MKNLARIGVATCAATLAGFIGAGGAHAVPLSQLGGTGTYAVGNIDPAQMLPGAYLTEGSVAGDVPCEWAVHTFDGGLRTEGTSIGSTRIEIAEGERLDTRNCQPWIRESVPSDAMLATIIGGGLAGTGSAVLGASLAAIMATALLTGKNFGIFVGLGVGAGSSEGPLSGSGAGSAGGALAGTGSGAGVFDSY